MVPLFVHGLLQRVNLFLSIRVVLVLPTLTKKASEQEERRESSLTLERLKSCQVLQYVPSSKYVICTGIVSSQIYMLAPV